MTVKELINELLECRMDDEVYLGSENVKGLPKLHEVEHSTYGTKGAFLDFPFDASDLDLERLGLIVREEDDV